MKFLKPLLFITLLFLTSTSQAQYVPHYTLFEYSPLTTNPAYTGAYEGSLRIGGIFRDQWFGFSSNNPSYGSSTNINYSPLCDPFFLYRCATDQGI